jgi:phenylalanyl-tRNA synthetase beta subunit
MGIERSVALNIIKSLTGLNLPYERIINVIKSAGVSYRRTDMLTDIRNAEGFVKYQKQVSGLLGNQTVPEAWQYNQAFSAPYKYRVDFKIEYVDIETGQRQIGYKSMYQDDYLKTGDYISQYPDYAEKEGTAEEGDIVGLTVIRLVRNTRIA